MAVNELGYRYRRIDIKPSPVTLIAVIMANSGFITGKKGFRKEYKVLVLGIRMKVPVLLADLTNIIRHGDICGLGAEDPLLIEMKSSTNQNARTNRQLEQLQVLANFFANDGADNFRGVLNTKRVALKNPEIIYENEINKCISNASSSGFNIVSPEPGVTYVAFTEQWFGDTNVDLNTLLENNITASTLVVSLTPDPSYLPLYPFTLSFGPENTLRFIQDEMNILVLIDLQIIKDQFKVHGLHAVALMDGEYAFQICVDQNDLMKGAFRISEQVFLRIACEFQSPLWFTKENSLFFEKASDATETLSSDAVGLLSEPLPGWQDAEDCF